MKNYLMGVDISVKRILRYKTKYSNYDIVYVQNCYDLVNKTGIEELPNGDKIVYIYY